MKKCKKCHAEKPLDEYPNEPRNNDGKSGTCLSCRSAINSQRYFANHSERRAKSKAFREANKDRLNAIAREYQRTHREDRAAYLKDYYVRNKDRLDALQEARRSEDPDYMKKWRKERKQHIKGYNREYKQQYRDRRNELRRHRLKTDPLFRMEKSCRDMLRRVLTATLADKTSSTYEMLGYTCVELKQRLEMNFQPGMNWDNYGEWHIDHKIPVSIMLARGENRPHIINALSNLQPLWATDNISKHNRRIG